jgi:hypothetical protein
MSFELSDKKWQLTLSDGRRSPSRYSVDAGDTAAAMQCIAKAKERCKLDPAAKVHSCYEAGRDGCCPMRHQNGTNPVHTAATSEIHWPTNEQSSYPGHTTASALGQRHPNV